MINKGGAMEILIIIISLLTISIELFFAPIVLEYHLNSNITFSTLINDIIVSPCVVALMIPVIIFIIALVSWVIKLLRKTDKR